VAHLYVFVKVGTTDAGSLCFLRMAALCTTFLLTEVAVLSTFSIYTRPLDSRQHEFPPLEKT
jgi:hypothetical protein